MGASSSRLRTAESIGKRVGAVILGLALTLAALG